jgi:hypothetical protein
MSADAAESERGGVTSCRSQPRPGCLTAAARQRCPGPRRRRRGASELLRCAGSRGSGRWRRRAHRRTGREFNGDLDGRPAAPLLHDVASHPDRRLLMASVDRCCASPVARSACHCGLLRSAVGRPSHSGARTRAYYENVNSLQDPCWPKLRIWPGGSLARSASGHCGRVG